MIEEEKEKYRKGMKERLESANYYYEAGKDWERERIRELGWIKRLLNKIDEQRI